MKLFAGRMAVILPFLVILIIPCSGQNLDNSLLWKISGKGLKKPSYLFGTFHLLNDAYLPAKLPEVLQIFGKADGIVVEMVIDSPSLTKARAHMLMFDKKLSALLDSNAYRLLAVEVQQTLGLDLSAFEHIKPAALSMILSLKYVQTSQADHLQYSGRPLDVFFADEGKRNGKTIHAFETQEEQMQLLLTRLTPEVQAVQLMEMVTFKEKTQEIQERITENYLQQNLQAIYDLSREIEKEMALSAVDAEAMITGRNRKWAAKLPALLEKGTQFIAVGALHLPGPDGLIELLRNQGYTVTAVQP